MTVDICYGGCGGIWFDPREIQRVDARGAANLHTVWRDRAGDFGRDVLGEHHQSHAH